MIAVENEIAIAAPPSKVWRLLTDFPHYRDWHPFIRLTGDAKAGAEINYEYTSVLRNRRERYSPATVTRFEPSAAFEWTMGIRHFFQHVESYELAADPLGTRLRHRIAYRGVVSILFRGKPSNAAHARICEADSALRSHFGGKKPSPAKPAKAESRRRQRR